MTKIDKQLYIKIGKQLREARERKELSLDYVAEKVNLTKKTIQRYETAESRITDETLKDICDVVGLDFEQISQAFMPNIDENVYLIDGLDNSKELTQDEKLIDLMTKAEKNHGLKLVFDKTADLGDKQLEQLSKMIDIIKDEE